MVITRLVWMLSLRGGLCLANKIMDKTVYFVDSLEFVESIDCERNTRRHCQAPPDFKNFTVRIDWDAHRV